jgi:hypothetical protein
MRALLGLLLLAVTASAATVKLYMKDGSYHAVREYEKVADRVKYFSTERGEWEEVPLTLVDLKRTEEEIRSLEQQRKKEAAVIDAEEKAEREQARELERIPVETGVFHVTGDLKVLKQAEIKAVSNKKRSILKAMSPIPIVSGKSTVELDGTASAFVLKEDRPEFYIRLAAEERFGIARMKPGKNTRIVQTWNIIPVSKELIEETELVEVFRKQLADGLYKIWPTKPLAPGEYAVIEYTEGKGNIQVWDFSVAPK